MVGCKGLVAQTLGMTRSILGEEPCRAGESLLPPGPASGGGQVAPFPLCGSLGDISWRIRSGHGWNCRYQGHDTLCLASTNWSSRLASSSSQDLVARSRMGDVPSPCAQIDQTSTNAHLVWIVTRGQSSTVVEVEWGGSRK